MSQSLSDEAARGRVAGAAWAAGVGVLASAFLLLVLLPLAGLLFTATPRELVAGLHDPLVGPAVRVTLLTTTASLLLVVLCGTPLAWIVARRRGRAWRIIETFVELPVVLPPAVAGVALLLAFGRRGLLGAPLGALGIGLPFSTAAVVVAQSFVAAPFYVQAAIGAFRRLDAELVLVARSLGASPSGVFFRVAVPLSRGPLAAGAALCWARALGEFGATLMFAGNLGGRTQTLPLAIYTALETDVRAAQSLSLLLVAVAAGLLVAIRAGAPRT